MFFRTLHLIFPISHYSAFYQSLTQQFVNRLENPQELYRISLQTLELDTTYPHRTNHNYLLLILNNCIK
nr:MAG TPA: hypothetical protein [Caudoviricetes sp.]